VADSAFSKGERLVHDRLREVRNQLGVTLEAAEVLRNETGLLGASRDDDVGHRKHDAHREKKQENDDQKAGPRPSALILFLDWVEIGEFLDVAACDVFRIGQ
jgi:hypothetical protein